MEITYDCIIAYSIMRLNIKAFKGGRDFDE